MLLNADVDKHKERICTEWPVSVQSSATFVIDVTSLKHADDVKKDNFGKWIHSDSHKTQYHVNFDENGGIRLEKCYTRVTGDDIYYLRRLHMYHPSNSEFRRLLAFISGLFLSRC